MRTARNSDSALQLVGRVNRDWDGRYVLRARPVLLQETATGTQAPRSALKQPRGVVPRAGSGHGRGAVQPGLPSPQREPAPRLLPPPTGGRGPDEGAGASCRRSAAQCGRRAEGLRASRGRAEPSRALPSRAAPSAWPHLEGRESAAPRRGALSAVCPACCGR